MKGFTTIDYDHDPTPRIGVGVIGYGFMGKVHSNAWLKIGYSFTGSGPRPRLVAMCGRDESRVRETARSFGFTGYYTDWHDMLVDPGIQIVDVCTPDNEHSAPAIAAARAGKHVICEKPLAMNVADARAMSAAADASGVTNMLCHNYRFIPAIRFARELIDKGAIGRIYHFRARYLQEPGHDPGAPLEAAWYASGTKSGVLLGIGSHVIDMARFLAGDIVSLSGLVSTFNTTRGSRAGALETVSADEANVSIVQFRSGATGTIESSGVATGRKNELAWDINGSKGSISFDLEDPNHLQYYSDDAPPELRGFANISVTDPRHPLRVVYLPPGHNAGWEYGHVHALHHFLDCAVAGISVQPWGATFQDGVRVQEAMEASVESSRSGQRITLPS